MESADARIVQFASLSPDGRWLAYESNESGRAGAQSKPFDVTPDGRILAIKEDDSIRPDHIVVVQNWLSAAHPRDAQESR